MELVKHETCLEYFRRRLSEGWKCISLEGQNAVLLSPWGQRRELDLRGDVETLRPNAGGAETNQEYYDGTTNPPDPNENYKQVDEAVPDDTSTYCTERHTASSERDLYNLPAHSVGSGTINKITVYWEFAVNNAKCRGAIRSNSTVTETAEYDPEDIYGVGVFGPYSQEWALNPADSQAWSWADIDALQIGSRLYIPSGVGLSMCTQTYVEIDYTPISLPTVTTQAASSVEATTATGNGNITALGGENCDIRGIVWDLASHGDPGNVAPGASGYANDVAETNSFGTGAFTRSLTGLPTGDTIYARAYAHNSAGYSYGAEVNFLTKPAAPTDVVASDNLNDKVTVTWTKSTGATGYQIYRDGTPLGWLGDVATGDDSGAGAPSITPGAAVAGDGASTAHVALYISGEGTSNGATHTYKVRARNTTGESVDSGTDTGKRIPGSLTYQWQRSAADGDAGYGNIAGTTEAYNDTAAPAPTVTPGTATAGDGGSTAHVTLSLAGESANIGAGRWYRCVLNANGCSQQITTTNRGYRGVGALTRQWYRSAADSDAGYGEIGGATTDPYNDVAAPAPTVTPGTGDASDGASSIHVVLSLSGQSANIGAGRWYKCLCSATGATPQYSTANRGYRGVGALTYQWQRSAADSDASYSNISGATTASYNDTGAPGNGQGRYYQCVESATGASPQTSSSDRGYRWMGEKTAHMAAKMI